MIYGASFTVESGRFDTLRGRLSDRLFRGIKDLKDVGGWEVYTTTDFIEGTNRLSSQTFLTSNQIEFEVTIFGFELFINLYINCVFMVFCFNFGVF